LNMNKQKNKPIVSLDEFDDTVSLFQLIPSGTGRGVGQLKTIIDSIHNNPIKRTKRPLSLVITGNQGCITHSRCFIRALGLEFVAESPAFLLQHPVAEIYNFFNPLLGADAHIISAMDRTSTAILKTVYEVITRGEYTICNSIKKSKEVVAVHKPLVISMFNASNLPDFIRQEITHIVKLENYTIQQLELIILQRLKYANIGYENEKLLKHIVAYSNSDLQCMVRLLKTAISVMMADSRKSLAEKDVKRAIRYC
jgi:hypothetical protein